MARIVHCLMATLFVVLVMISSNSPSCQACLLPYCLRVGGPCFKARNNICTDDSCMIDCEANRHFTYNAYCKKPKRSQEPYKCCCPK
ncbi:unnamed protein product [Urochloa decumbens]|uniref:Uncharacterized protein n=1 Tax=Urochloa decumbens TaxID=240449 RepID=A0ABC9AKV7_9POAL